MKAFSECKTCKARLPFPYRGGHTCPSIETQDSGMDSMMDASLSLVPIAKVDHPRIRGHWSDIAEFLRAPKAAKYPTQDDFAQTRFGPL